MRTALSHWWRSFLGIGDEGRLTALEILRKRYVDETEHSKEFTQHAGQMHYPQFREGLLHIAAEETKHAGLLAADPVLFERAVDSSVDKGFLVVGKYGKRNEYVAVSLGDGAHGIVRGLHE